MNKCQNCHIETANPKFCSRRCAAIWNNQLMPKRKRQRSYCRVCGIEVAHRRVLCDQHNPRTEITGQTTVSDIRKRAKYQAHARIRQLARRAYRDYGLPLQCAVCDYSLHVEICHKLSISEFPATALVKEVNARDNLLCLCPNHHWEFDHGFLSL